MITLPKPSRMYEALVRRDPSFEGVFVVGVKTTGVFCRPTCGARKPHVENVEFFPEPRAALHAGYRPCKRCRPMDNGPPQPAWVARLFDEVERRPSQRIRSSDLRAMSIDPAQARRYFNARYGMTFQAYHRARRMCRALADVRAGRDVLSTGLRSGYQSASGFRDAFERIMGAAPGRARRLAPLVTRWLETPLGAMVAVAGDEGLCLLEFVDRRMLETQLARVRCRFRGPIVPGDNRHLDLAARELEGYFCGKPTRFAVPLSLRGTPFQEKVWRRLQEIPYGQTLSYAALAGEIGFSGAQRAVGRANGDNRLAIIVPCHRVVRSDGSLCGYGGGLWRKKWLLEHERTQVMK
jgi:AraC family transcriptional regulator of adaptative response/methylated-DNA-[protein]-cysteine methyltransferase